MSDYTSLQTKVDALKAKVEQDSITPVSLGSILDDIIAELEAIDADGLADGIAGALSTATQALNKAKQALSDAATADSHAVDAAAVAAQATTAITAIQQQLPELDKLKVFAQVVEDVAVTPASSTSSSSSAGCSVVYNSATASFLLQVYTSGIIHPSYYSNWADADYFGTGSTTGRKPLSGKLYIASAQKQIFACSGAKLTPLTYGVQPPIRCTDEADLAAKVASGDYPEGQEFYIPEED